MKMPQIKHNHLRNVIEDIYTNNNQLSDELLTRLINEFRYSNLIMPATDDLNFIIFEVEGKNYTPLFTDSDEYHKFYKNANHKLLSNSFELYQNIIRLHDIDGYILNPASENYLFEDEFILSIAHIPQSDFTSTDALDGDGLKECYDNLDNESLENFINKRENIGYWEGLFEEFSKSRFLTLMLSANDLSFMAKDGVISMTRPLAFMYIDKVGGEYACIFTSKNKICEVDVDEKLSKYAQLVNLATLVNYVLSNDMDGLIVNPQVDDILIPRGELLKNSLGFERFCNDSKLNNGIFHLFLID